jgi:hypothetical protein
MKQIIWGVGGLVVVASGVIVLASQGHRREPSAILTAPDAAPEADYGLTPTVYADGTIARAGNPPPVALPPPRPSTPVAPHVETRAERRAREAAERATARVEAAEARARAAAERKVARARELFEAREEGRAAGRRDGIGMLRAHVMELGVDLDFSTRGPNDTILSIHAPKGCNMQLLEAFLKMQDPAHPLASAGFASIECAGGVSLSLH